MDSRDRQYQTGLQNLTQPSSTTGFVVPQAPNFPGYGTSLPPGETMLHPVGVHSAPTALPGGNVNLGFQHSIHDNTRFSSPPSYEEAIKGMTNVHPHNEDYKPYQYNPHYSQFSSSEPHFYPQTYCIVQNDTDVNDTCCGRICGIVFPIIFVIILVRALMFLFD